MSAPGERAQLTEEEARGVVDLIRPCLMEYGSKYDERKYPPKIYEDLLRAFRVPDSRFLVAQEFCQECRHKAGSQ